MIFHVGTLLKCTQWHFCKSLTHMLRIGTCCHVRGTKVVCGKMLWIHRGWSITFWLWLGECRVSALILSVGHLSRSNSSIHSFCKFLPGRPVWTLAWTTSLGLHFDSHFPCGPGLSDTRMPPFWIWSELRMMEVVVTTGATRSVKLQSSHHHQQTDAQLFPGQITFLSPNQQYQSTEGKGHQHLNVAIKYVGSGF